MSVSGPSACPASRTSEGRRLSARPAQPASSSTRPTAGSPSTHLVTPQSVSPRACRSAERRRVAVGDGVQVYGEPGEDQSHSTSSAVDGTAGACRRRPGRGSGLTVGRRAGARVPAGRGRRSAAGRPGRSGRGGARQRRGVLEVVDLAAGEGGETTVVRACVYHSVRVSRGRWDKAGAVYFADRSFDKQGCVCRPPTRCTPSATVTCASTAWTSSTSPPTARRPSSCSASGALRANVEAVVGSFRRFHPATEVFYASKACSNLWFLRVARKPAPASRSTPAASSTRRWRPGSSRGRSSSTASRRRGRRSSAQSPAACAPSWSTRCTSWAGSARSRPAWARWPPWRRASTSTCRRSRTPASRPRTAARPASTATTPRPRSASPPSTPTSSPPACTCTSARRSRAWSRTGRRSRRRSTSWTRWRRPPACGCSSSTPAAASPCRTVRRR